MDKKIHRSTLNAIKFSHITLCVIDSINAFRVQDLVTNIINSFIRIIIKLIKRVLHNTLLIKEEELFY